MPEGVQDVSRSSIVEDHQCSHSPAHVTSCVEAECVCSTFACSWNALFVWYFLREAPFTIPWRRDVVSYPRTECRKRMCWHMSGPSRCLTALTVLCSSLVQGKIRGRAILSLRGGSKGEPEGMCHHLQGQCCRT